MDIPFIYIVLLSIIHYIGDYIFQSRKIADNKSKRIDYLLIHGLQYTIVLYMSLLLLTITNIIPFEGILKYSILNGIIHTIVDYFTSKLTTKYYARKDYGSFFKILGLDQLIHISTLILTINIFL